jgi:hypothetical protein
MKAPSSGIRQLPARATLLTGIVAAVLLAVRAATAGEQAMPSLLCAWLFFLGLSLGSLMLISVHNLTGGAWGRPLRPVLEGAVRLLPLSVLFALPLLFRLPELYPWMNASASPTPAAAQMKMEYLGAGFFAVRALIYFAVWMGLGWSLRATPDSGLPGSVATPPRRASAAGLILMALTVTFSQVDWVMSLTPQWLSTAFGMLTAIGMALAALAGAVVCVVWRGGGHDMPARCHDLGNLLLTLVLVWAYLAFMQYLIIWMEDLPDDISWFLPRLQTSWRELGVMVILIHFALPFFALLSRRLKRSPRQLAGVAALLLLACIADAYWEVLPSLRPDGLAFDWNDLLALLALGGIWCGLLLRDLNGPRRRAPLGDAWLAGAGDG